MHIFSHIIWFFFLPKYLGQNFQVDNQYQNCAIEASFYFEAESLDTLYSAPQVAQPQNERPNSYSSAQVTQQSEYKDMYQCMGKRFIYSQA